jgi:hypothetical protein
MKITKPWSAVVLAIVFSIVAVAFAGAAPPAPPAGSVTIDGVEYSGEGCPAGTASIAVSDDRLAFTVIFSAFTAELESGGAPTIRRKCKLHAKVTIPRNWQYALTSVDFRGFVSLESGVKATEQATYHMSGESPTTTAAVTWPGPMSDDFAMRDVGDAAPVLWSRCGQGRNLMITTDLLVDNKGNPQGSGLLTMDSIDSEIFHLQWKRCKS